MHENNQLLKNRASMIRTMRQAQIPLEGFETPLGTGLRPDNRWGRLSQGILWDALAEEYYQSLSTDQGWPVKDARLVIAAVIIKHKRCLSDEETVQQVRKEPSLQYFAGLTAHQTLALFASSLLVQIRRHKKVLRLGIKQQLQYLRRNLGLIKHILITAADARMACG